MMQQIATPTKEGIQDMFRTAMDQFLPTLNAFTDESFNKIPFEGSWTGGQVAEHLYKSVSGLPGLFLTESETAERDVYEKCELIGSVFLNFDVKLKSPEFILPTDKPKQVSFFVQAYERTAGEISKAMLEMDLSRIFTRFPLPQIGQLTGWEWVYFSAAHTIRHTRQLRNILSYVNA